MSSYNKITKTDLADGALYEKVNDMVDALNADKIERTQVGIRKGGTAYKVGDKCFCEYHGDFLLECTTAGTSAVGQLDTSGIVTDGATRTDGSVVWTFRSVATKKELTDVKNNSLNTTQITNCITHIPQDIKLELVDGTLTLKVGSKVYDGSGNVINITNDKTLSSVTSSTSRTGVMVFYDTQNKSLYYFNDTQMFSGTTQPTSSEIGQYAIWYDTSNKVLKRTADDGATWISGVSLPLGSFTVENNTILSLDQVFNGFGYIGSTAFVLPGVKGLAPNGRNTDGTLKNAAFTVNNVLTTTDTSGATGGLEYYFNASGVYRANFGTVTYDEVNNTVNGAVSGVVLLDPNAYRTGGKVTRFNPKTTFQAVDYNEVKSIVFPSQAGKTGKALLTDGENAYWGDTSGVIIRDWSS